MQTIPRAITDSDVARASAADSTPELQQLIAAGAGDDGSNPSRVGSPETSGVTVGAIPAAGTDHFLTFLRDGDIEWLAGSGNATLEEAETAVAWMMTHHGPEFAQSYRIDRCAVIAAGEQKPFVGTGPIPEVDEPDVEGVVF
jgi:hypothetical protein